MSRGSFHVLITQHISGKARGVLSSSSGHWARRWGALEARWRPKHCARARAGSRPRAAHTPHDIVRPWASPKNHGKQRPDVVDTNVHDIRQHQTKAAGIWYERPDVVDTGVCHIQAAAVAAMDLGLGPAAREITPNAGTSPPLPIISNKSEQRINKSWKRFAMPYSKAP